MALLLCAAVLCACGKSTPDTSAVECGGVLFFGFSPADYAEGYNSFCRSDSKLRPVSSWTKLTDENESSPFAGWEIRRFKQDESCWNDAAVMLYPCADGSHIRAITFDFDDHAYSESSLAEFRRNSVNTICLLTGESETTAQRLFEELYIQAAEGKGWYPDSDGVVPRIIYCEGSVGFYPYFRNGGMLRICAVPVTEDYLAELVSRGAEVNYIEQFR